MIPAPNHAELDGRLAASDARIETAIDGSLPAEGYTIEAGRKLIKVTGGSEAGVFYGLQTVNQMKENGGVSCSTKPGISPARSG